MRPHTFAGLKPFGYNIIHADPPWPFQNYSAKGEDRNPNRHYPTMPIEQIKALPVGDIAAGDCALFLWVVDPLLDQGIETLKAWGFRFTTVAFTWAKRSSRDTAWHMGTGYYTRGNPETCLLGMMGRLERRSGGVRQLIVDPVRQHSRKPDRVADDIVRLFGDLPRVELFSRTSRPGWETWGNQVGAMDGVEASRTRHAKGRPLRGEVAGLAGPGEDQASLSQQTEDAHLL